MNFMQLLSKPKQLFLIDGIGAIVSALFLGLVLVQLQSVIGMPKSILYGFAIAPCFFAVYSFSCYYFLKANWSTYLRVIAICNLLYCCATTWLLFCYFESLTALGIIYFVLELLLIIVLVFAELRSTEENR